MAKIIYRDKAEFLLNAIRLGNMNELMKAEVIKTMIEAGYYRNEVLHYLENGEWPTMQKEDYFNNISKESSIPLFYNKRTTSIKKLSIASIAFGLLFLVSVFSILLLFEEGVNVDKVETSTKVIEQTTDGHRAL